MDLGEKLFKLRKEKNLSQEEVAEKLNVTRQSVSKWETNQSTPDFDKIVPLCELYGVSSDYLLTGKEANIEKNNYQEKNVNKIKAMHICTSVFLYFIAVIWIIVAESFIDDRFLVGVFLFICALATIILIYGFVSLPNKKKEEKKENKYKRIDNIISLLFTFIYLLISFITMQWAITWLIWIVYSIVLEITHIILDMKESKNEEEK